MKQIIGYIATIVLAGLIACDAGFLTSPDDDDMEPVVAAVGRLPQGLRDVIEFGRWLEAIDTLRRTNPDQPVADIYCGDDKEPSSALTIKQLYYHMKDFFDGFSATSSRYRPGVAGYGFWQFLDERLAEHGCRADTMPYVDFTHISDKVDPPQQSNREIAQWLIALSAIELTRFPSLMQALGLATGAGGAIIALDGIGLVLCPLSTDIWCPDDPGNPGFAKPGGQGGGDR